MPANEIDKLVLDLLVDDELGCSGAHLAGIVEHTGGGGLGHLIDIGHVGEHDVRRLAAAFERDVLHVRLAGVAQEQLADLGRAGEGDHVHIHVAAERLAGGLAIAGQDIEHAVGQAGLGGELGDADGGQRRLLGRLEDDGIAGGKRRTDLPAGHEQREVPRHDGGDDAERLAGDHRD